MKLKIPKYLAVMTIIATMITGCSYDEFVEAIDWKSIDIFRFDSSPLTYKIDDAEIVEVEIIKRDDQIPPELEYPSEYTGTDETASLVDSEENLGADSSGADSNTLTSGQKFDSLRNALKKTKEGKNKYLPFNSGLIVNHMGRIRMNYLANTNNTNVVFHNGIDIVPLIEPEIFFKLLEIRGTMDEILTDEQMIKIEEVFNGGIENIAIHPSSSTGEKEIKNNVLTVTYTENATILKKEILQLLFLSSKELSTEELNREIFSQAKANKARFIHGVNMMIAKRLLDNSNIKINNTDYGNNFTFKRTITGVIEVAQFKKAFSLAGFKRFETFLDMKKLNEDMPIKLEKTISAQEYIAAIQKGTLENYYFKEDDKQWIEKTAEYLKMKQNNWNWTEQKTFDKLLQMSKGNVLKFNDTSFSRTELLEILQNMYTAKSDVINKAYKKSSEAKESIETYRVRYYPVVGAEKGTFNQNESLGYLGVSKNNISIEGLPYLHMDMIVSQSKRSILAFNKPIGLFDTKQIHGRDIKNEGEKNRYALILGESGFYENTESLSELQKHYGGIWGSSSKSYSIDSTDQHLNTVAYKYGNKSFKYEKDETNKTLLTEVTNMFDVIFEPKKVYEEQQNKEIKDMGF